MPVRHRLRLLAFPMRTKSGAPPCSGMRISRFPHKERLHMPGSQTAPGRTSTRSNASVRLAFRNEYSVGARFYLTFAAQWLAYAIPYRRFADILTEVCARLGADVVCYAFIVADLHRLLLAGLPAHAQREYFRLRPSFTFPAQRGLLLTSGAVKPVSFVGVPFARDQASRS